MSRWSSSPSPAPHYLGLNGGPHFKHDECFSFQVATDDQAETDCLWNAIVGNASLAHPDRAVARRALKVVMPMKKIDIATIEAVWRALNASTRWFRQRRGRPASRKNERNSSTKRSGRAQGVIRARSDRRRHYACALTRNAHTPTSTWLKVRLLFAARASCINGRQSTAQGLWRVFPLRLDHATPCASPMAPGSKLRTCATIPEFNTIGPKA